jgi:hypothetical protein
LTEKQEAEERGQKEKERESKDEVSLIIGLVFSVIHAGSTNEV